MLHETLFNQLLHNIFRYSGPLLDHDLLCTAAELGAASVELSKLIEWATKELAIFANIEEHVNAISSNYTEYINCADTSYYCLDRAHTIVHHTVYMFHVK